MSRRQNGDEQMNTTTTAIIRMSHTMYNFPFHPIAESIHSSLPSSSSLSLFHFSFFSVFHFIFIFIGFDFCLPRLRHTNGVWNHLHTQQQSSSTRMNWMSAECVCGTAKNVHSKWNALPWNNFSILCKVMKINDDASKWRSQISFYYLFNESTYTLPTPLSSHC